MLSEAVFRNDLALHVKQQNKSISNSQVREKNKKTILIVEDSLPERARLVAMLSKFGYRIMEANNGQRALEILKKETVSLILSDWRMPIMDGFELCLQSKKTSPLAPYFILLTARDSPADLIAAMDAGADDYLTKPFNGEELRVRLQAGFRQIEKGTQLLKQNSKINRLLARAEAQQIKSDKDLIAAQKLQQKILPRKNQRFNQIRFTYSPKKSNSINGELCSIIPLGKRHIAFYQFNLDTIGIRAAMLSFAIANFLQQHSRAPASHKGAIKMQDPANVLQKINIEFQSKANDADCFSMTYGIIDSMTGKGKIAHAGDSVPVISDKHGDLTQLGTTNLPIGKLLNFEYQNIHFVLQDKANLVLHKDFNSLAVNCL